MIRENLVRLGYSKEEEYFYEQNKKLIEKFRNRLDKERQSTKQHQQQSGHWMKCPKCAGQMSEIDLVGTKVDHCGSCDGVYFDRGELEIVLSARHPAKYLSVLSKKLNSLSNAA